MWVSVSRILLWGLGHQRPPAEVWEHASESSPAREKGFAHHSHPALLE